MYAVACYHGLTDKTKKPGKETKKPMKKGCNRGYNPKRPEKLMHYVLMVNVISCLPATNLNNEARFLCIPSS